MILRRCSALPKLPSALLPDLAPAVLRRIAAEIFLDVERPVGEPAYVARREVVPHAVLVRDRLAVDLAVDVDRAHAEIAERARLPGGDEVGVGHLLGDQRELFPIDGLDVQRAAVL